MSSNLGESLDRFFSGLYRDRENGWLFGVCAGLADRYRVNVVGVRVLFGALLVFWTIPTGIVYLAMGLLLRDRPLSYRGNRDERGFWSYPGNEDHGGNS